MRQVLTVLLVVTLVWLGWRFNNYAKQKIGTPPPSAEGGEAPAPGKLRGLPASLEPGYEAAKREGPEGVRKWLAQHQNDLQEPRLTDIELDYVLLVGRSNSAEAKRILGGIKQRITPNSPVYKRFEQLAKTYE